MNRALPWSAQLAEIQPMFHDLQQLLGGRLPQHWPSPADLDLLLPRVARTRAGQVIRFRIAAGGDSAADYERGIHASGHIPTREQSWHDAFNALVWSLFTQTKTALNAAHVRDLAGGANTGRSRYRDALTLLDETGLVVASSDPRIAHLNRHHRWRELFVERRNAWWRSIRPYPVGHGLLEQCLEPYLGLTAKALHVSVPPGFFNLPLARQYALLDDLVARRISSLSPGDLLPLPVLGIPGWDARNADPGFYDNTDYFRPRRARSAGN